jgi:hypothetical protein
MPDLSRSVNFFFSFFFSLDEYILRKGFPYMVAVMDRHSRKAPARRPADTMEMDFCFSDLKDALAKYASPDIFNIDQGRSTAEGFSLFSEKSNSMSASPSGVPRQGRGIADINLSGPKNAKSRRLMRNARTVYAKTRTVNGLQDRWIDWDVQRGVHHAPRRTAGAGLSRD